MKKGTISLKKLDINEEVEKAIKKHFIAIDTETNGGRAEENDYKIIEIGASIFEDEIFMDSFGSLINRKIKIMNSYSYKKHGIKIENLKDAPSLEDVYKEFMEFVRPALNGTIILCGYGCDNDFNGIKSDLEILGYSGVIKYFDVKDLADKRIKGIRKSQEVISEYLGIKNEQLHRAETDAYVCAQIAISLVDMKPVEIRESKKNNIDLESIYSIEELGICSYIQKVLKRRSCDISKLGFYKNTKDEIDILNDVSKVFAFKFSKRKKYFLFDDREDINDIENLSKFEPKIVKYYLNSDESYSDEEKRYFIKEKRSKESKIFVIKDNMLEKYLDRAQKQLEEDRIQKENEKATKQAKPKKTKTKLEKRIQEKTIVQLNEEGIVLGEYVNSNQAAIATGVNGKSIRDCIAGKQKRAGGYIWKKK